MLRLKEKSYISPPQVLHDLFWGELQVHSAEVLKLSVEDWGISFVGFSFVEFLLCGGCKESDLV